LGPERTGLLETLHSLADRGPPRHSGAPTPLTASLD
jgi:hypothetical protein